jgi:hypothetical protein
MSAAPISIGASFPESIMPGTPLPDIAGADLTEEVTFICGALAVAFQAANADGTAAGTPVKSAWSQLTNSSSVQDSIVLN